MRRLSWIMAAAWLSGSGLLQGAPNQTQVTLYLSAQAAQPGETLWAGLQMRMAPHWHTYWINPGEAGKATEIDWTLPSGVTAGPIHWPVPEKYDWAGLFNYVYHDEAILLIPLTLGPEIQPGPITIAGEASWLECEEQCVPGSGTFSASLTVGSESALSEHQDLFQRARARLPGPLTNQTARAWWESAGSEGTRSWVVSWSRMNPGAARFDFFPLGGESYVINPQTETLAGGEQVRLRKVLESFGGPWPGRLDGLLVEQDPEGKLLGAYQASLAMADSEAGARGDRSPASAVAPPDSGGPGLLAVLGLAFLGGLILNIMPCVLPVISLKILGFVNQSRESPAQVRRLGIVYMLGVMASFLVLAGLVIGVQRAGREASWGMQFGNPVFLVGITVLVTLVALNLFGVFEVHLGSRTLGAAGTLASQEGASGAFFNGILATALATPCTAPFLSVALGFAFTQPPATIVLVFVTVAMGLAAPYLVLSWHPAWLKFIPKPGPWMQRFKVAMGFPMLATALWLFSILTRHYGGAGVLWVGLFLVLVAVAAWIWGEFVQKGIGPRWLGMGMSLGLVVAAYFLVLETQLQWRSPRSVTDDLPGRAIRSEGSIPWESWSVERVAQARAQGRPVLVDFTADWCLTCKANKKTSLEIPSVAAKLQEINALALLADNTLVRDDIARELKQYGRAGVPLVLVYPANAQQPPLVLPTVLTPSLVLDALEKAAN